MTALSLFTENIFIVFFIINSSFYFGKGIRFAFAFNTLQTRTEYTFYNSQFIGTNQAFFHYDFPFSDIIYNNYNSLFLICQAFVIIKGRFKSVCNIIKCKIYICFFETKHEKVRELEKKREITRE